MIGKAPLLALLLASPLTVPPGFATTPVSGGGELLVASRAGVTLVVRRLPLRLTADADPEIVARELEIGAETRATAATGFAAPAIRATWGDAAAGGEAILVAAGEESLLASCHWGTLKLPAPPVGVDVARRSCVAALPTLEGAGPPPAEAPLFTAPPPGFRRGLGRPGLLYFAADPGAATLTVLEVNQALDPAALGADDLSRLTDAVVGGGLQVHELRPERIAGAAGFRFRGRLRNASPGVQPVPDRDPHVRGAILPRGGRTLVLLLATAEEPRDDRLAAIAASVVGLTAAAPERPDAGAAAAAPAGRDVKQRSFLLVVGLCAAALLVTFALVSAREAGRRQRRAEIVKRDAPR